MSQTGYVPSYSTGLPEVPLRTSTAITNTTYSFSDIYNAGDCQQISMCVKATLNVGTTSLELKLQQGISQSALDDWFDIPLLDVANKATVSNEYVVTAKSYVVRLDASTAGNNLGPIAFPLLMPFYRLAYKVTGVGSANVGVLLIRTKI